MKLPPAMWGSDTGTPVWYAVQTSEWMEHKVAKWLKAMRLFGVYLPTVYERVIEEIRPKWCRVPMFREYVFLRMGNFERNVAPVLRTPGAVALIGPITEEEMDVVKWCEFEANRPGTPTARPRRGWRKRRT